MTAGRRRGYWKWLALAAGVALVLRHVLQPHASRSTAGDFDEEAFLQNARELARRERHVAASILQHSQDERLLALARMSLAQHQASDGVWVGLGSEAADDVEAPDTPWTMHADASFDEHAAWAMQGVLDDAWPCFDLASQHADSPEQRDWALRTMAWLEEAEQTLAPVLEQWPDSESARNLEARPGL